MKRFFYQQSFVSLFAIVLFLFFSVEGLVGYHYFIRAESVFDQFVSYSRPEFSISYPSTWEVLDFGGVDSFQGMYFFSVSDSVRQGYVDMSTFEQALIVNWNDDLIDVYQAVPTFNVKLTDEEDIPRLIGLPPSLFGVDDYNNVEIVSRERFHMGSHEAYRIIERDIRRNLIIDKVIGLADETLRDEFVIADRRPTIFSLVYVAVEWRYDARVAEAMARSFESHFDLKNHSSSRLVDEQPDSTMIDVSAYRYDLEVSHGWSLDQKVVRRDAQGGEVVVVRSVKEKIPELHIRPGVLLEIFANPARSEIMYFKAGSAVYVFHKRTKSFERVELSAADMVRLMGLRLGTFVSQSGYSIQYPADWLVERREAIGDFFEGAIFSDVSSGATIQVGGSSITNIVISSREEYEAIIQKDSAKRLDDFKDISGVMKVIRKESSLVNGRRVLRFDYIRLQDGIRGTQVIIIADPRVIRDDLGNERYISLMNVIDYRVSSDRYIDGLIDAIVQSYQESIAEVLENKI